MKMTGIEGMHRQEAVATARHRFPAYEHMWFSGKNVRPYLAAFPNALLGIYAPTPLRRHTLAGERPRGRVQVPNRLPSEVLRRRELLDRSELTQAWDRRPDPNHFQAAGERDPRHHRQLEHRSIAFPAYGNQ
jgi:hypothetical protein